MRTVNKVGGANGTIFTEFYGNTTDVKPTEDVPNGSAFYEIDNNMQEYRFDKENKIWYPITRGGTAPSDDYLPLSGGIMTGDINMNGNSLLNAKSIYANDNTDINKVKYISGLLPTNIFINNYNTVGYNLVGINISENTFTFYSNDKNNKHSQIEIIYNVEDNLPRLSFKAGYNDRINLPVLLKGVDTPVDDTDAANKQYVDQENTKYLPLTGGAMQGAINMSGYQVENASELTLGETGYVGIIPHEITSEIDNGTTVELSNPKTKKDIKLRGIDTPTNDNDTVNKKYADNIKEYGIEHSPVLDSGQEEFVLGQNDLAYVFKNSMVMDSGDRFYFADPVSLTDGRLVPFITSAMTGEEYHLLVGTYPKGVQDGTLAPVQIDGVAEPTGDNMAVNKKYVDDSINSVTKNQVTIQKADNANMRINLTVNGDEASGVLDLTDKNGNPVIVRGVDTPVQDTDAVNKKYFETHLPSDFVPNKDLDMKQYKLINTSAVEIYGGINDSANNTYFIRETSQASINTDTKVPEYVKVITGVHTGNTNQDVILRGIRVGQQKNDAVNYGQFKTLADSFERCQHDVESLNAWKMTFDENQVTNTVNSIIKYTDVAYELTIASGEEQWYSYDLAMQSGYTPISATLVIDDTNPFVGHCSLDITPDGTYNALIYLKSQGDDKTCNCKVRLVWIKNQ